MVSVGAGDSGPSWYTIDLRVNRSRSGTDTAGLIPDRGCGSATTSTAPVGTESRNSPASFRFTALTRIRWGR